jgi:hypothetical protein
MILFGTLLQDLRYATRTLFRNAGFTTVSVFALALGIGVNTVAFTAYKAFVVRPLDGRDPGTLVNFALRLQSGATNARFSYPDYESYRDHLHSFTGVIAFSIDQLRFTTSGIANRRSAEAGSWMDGCRDHSLIVFMEPTAALMAQLFPGGRHPKQST